MAEIFLSYRRQDSESATGRLADDLEAHFGDERVFRDHEIAAGENFVEAIRRSVESSTVVLAIVGRRWLDARDAEGRRRLDDRADFVRLEIELALAARVPVVPVLVEGATMPAALDLPPSLAEFSRCQAVELSDRRWRDDAEKLIETLESRFAIDADRAPLDRIARGARRRPQPLGGRPVRPRAPPAATDRAPPDRACRRPGARVRVPVCRDLAGQRDAARRPRPRSDRPRLPGRGGHRRGELAPDGRAGRPPRRRTAHRRARAGLARRRSQGELRPRGSDRCVRVRRGLARLLRRRDGCGDGRAVDRSGLARTRRRQPARVHGVVCAGADAIDGAPRHRADARRRQCPHRAGRGDLARDRDLVRRRLGRVSAARSRRRVGRRGWRRRCGSRSSSRSSGCPCSSSDVVRGRGERCGA